MTTASSFTKKKLQQCTIAYCNVIRSSGISDDVRVITFPFQWLLVRKFYLQAFINQCVLIHIGHNFFLAREIEIVCYYFPVPRDGCITLWRKSRSAMPRL